MKVVAKIHFEFNGIKYLKGEEVKVKSIKEVIKLNELGYINPLNYEELTLIERELEKGGVKNGH